MKSNLLRISLKLQKAFNEIRSDQDRLTGKYLKRR